MTSTAVIRDHDEWCEFLATRMILDPDHIRCLHASGRCVAKKEEAEE